MDGAGELDRERRQDPRAELHVELMYDSFSSFLSVAAGNLSRGGMFLTVPDPAPAGTRLSFEARLRDGSSLIRGQGEVVWTRTEVTAGLPTGMAIRFTRLTAQARELIARLLEQYPDGKSGSVRLGGVRLGKARALVGTAPAPVERSLPLGEPLAPEPSPADRDRPDRPPVLPEQEGVPRRALNEEAQPTTQPHERAPEIRVTDEVGSEFDFTLPPWETEEIPAELRPPNPVRMILIALAVLCLMLVVIYLGPLNLIESVGHIGSAISHRLMPQSSTRPTPATVQRAGSVELGPNHDAAAAPSAAPEDGGSQAADTTERSGQTAASASLIVDRVAWRRDAAGVVVTVEANRDIPRDAVHYGSLSEPPRYVVRIIGVTDYRGNATLELHREDLLRIRIGVHGDHVPAEIDIVLDLGSSLVTVEPLGIHGRRVELAVRFGG